MKLNGIKRARVAKGLSQKQLAGMVMDESFKVSQQSVAMWEKGVTLPRADKLPAIARVLDVTVDELLREDAPAGQ